MKIALFGKGKTGSLVQSVAKDVTVFDSKSVYTAQDLMKFDGIICFVPGEAFLKLIPIFLEAKIPVIVGSTGMKLPENLDQSIRMANTSWVFGKNFSFGINLLKNIFNTLHAYPKLNPSAKFSMREIHHTKKLDAPSGTAVKWKEWLGVDLSIESIREGDEIGYHEVKVTSPTEEIIISHRSLDRKMFAEGAVWALEQVINNKTTGLIEFEDLVLTKI